VLLSLLQKQQLQQQLPLQLPLLQELTWFAVGEVSTIQVENGFHVTTGVNQSGFTVEYTSVM